MSLFEIRFSVLFIVVDVTPYSFKTLLYFTPPNMDSQDQSQAHAISQAPFTSFDCHNLIVPSNEFHGGIFIYSSGLTLIMFILLITRFCLTSLEGGT